MSCQILSSFQTLCSYPDTNISGHNKLHRQKFFSAKMKKEILEMLVSDFMESNVEYELDANRNHKNNFLFQSHIYQIFRLPTSMIYSSKICIESGECDMNNLYRERCIALSL